MRNECCGYMGIVHVTGAHGCWADGSAGECVRVCGSQVLHVHLLCSPIRNKATEEAPSNRLVASRAGGAQWASARPTPSARRRAIRALSAWVQFPLSTARVRTASSAVISATIVCAPHGLPSPLLPHLTLPLSSLLPSPRNTPYFLLLLDSLRTDCLPACGVRLLGCLHTSFSPPLFSPCLFDDDSHRRSHHSNNSMINNPSESALSGLRNRTP